MERRRVPDPRRRSPLPDALDDFRARRPEPPRLGLHPGSRSRARARPLRLPSLTRPRRAAPRGDRRRASRDRARPLLRRDGRSASRDAADSHVPSRRPGVARVLRCHDGTRSRGLARRLPRPSAEASHPRGLEPMDLVAATRNRRSSKPEGAGTGFAGVTRPTPNRLTRTSSIFLREEGRRLF